MGVVCGCIDDREAHPPMGLEVDAAGVPHSEVIGERGKRILVLG